MRLKQLLLTAGLLLASAGVANAATVTNDLNLRSGPGTRFSIIAAMPAGSHVDVLGCTGSWCRVDWRGRQGFASASYLAGGGGPVYAAPVYAAPAYVAPPVPIFGFGIGFGGGWHHYHGWHHGWRGGHHWHGHGGHWHHH